MFWLHGEDLPAGVGNERFCAMHLVYIAFFFAASIAYVLIYRRLDARRQKAADRITGALVFFFGFCEYFITFLVGRFTLYTLPIHVCSLMYVLVPLHALTNHVRSGSFLSKLHTFLGAVIFHPGILAAWAALLFPDWLYYPFWNYLSICGFLSHGLVSVYGMSILVKNTEAPDRPALILRDFACSAAFLLCGMLIMYLFDRATGTNYWFMTGPGNDSPLMSFYEKGGYNAYLTAFIAAGCLVTALWYGLRCLILLRHRT